MLMSWHLEMRASAVTPPPLQEAVALTALSSAALSGFSQHTRPFLGLSACVKLLKRPTSQGGSEHGRPMEVFWVLTTTLFTRLNEKYGSSSLCEGLAAHRADTTRSPLQTQSYRDVSQDKVQFE